MTLFSFRGKTSYPYLSGYTWIHFCRWKMLNTDMGSGPVRLDAASVQPFDTVFVDYNDLKDFQMRILPAIPGEIILVTANYGYGADHPMPGPFESLLQDPKIIAWFVQNIDRTPSSKLIPIPIGIANPCWEHGNTELLDHWIPIALAKKTKSIFCYLNHTMLPNRIDCTAHFHNIGVPFTRRKKFELYLQDLSESVFVVSPPGNGVDCHRTWEALMMGCYPIVQSSKLNPLYEGLPVVVIEDWREVTMGFLKEKQSELNSQIWEREKLYAPFWFEKVKKLQWLRTTP